MSRERREVIYSVVIITLIPLLFALNTLLIITHLRTNFNSELKRKADLINYVLAQSVKQHLQDTKTQETLTTLITDIKYNHPEIKTIRIVAPLDGNYAIKATSDTNDQKLNTTDTLQYDIVTKRKLAVAKLIETTTETGQDTRAWEVATPVLDGSNKVVAVVSSQVLTTDADELVDSTVKSAYIVVFVSMLAVVLLLIHHFKFVGYADLLRRQKEVNQTMGDFLSVATHELKAPMSIIKGFTANVLDGSYGEVSEKIHQPLQTVIEQTDRLNNLVVDLLNISRIEQGRIAFDMQAVDVVETIKVIVTNYAQKAASKNITFTYNPPADLPKLYADAGRLQEIMTNLIDNAIKYSVQGQVTIGHQEQGGFVLTRVKDTGIGISSEDRARLFQRFYRIQNEQTKNIAGTGLGLWIIKQYIEKMGGKIEVDSIINTGTEFTVWLKKADKK